MTVTLEPDAARRAHDTQRIVLFGGTFDPPHIGHVAALDAIEQALHPALIVVMPSGQTPDKDAARFSASERCQLSRIAFANRPHVMVSDEEVQRFALLGQPSFTVDTLHALAAQAQAAELVMAIGADRAHTLPQWQGWKWIAANTKIAVVERRDRITSQELRDCVAALARAGARVEVVPMDAVDVSATAVREALDHEDTAALASVVPPAVIAAIAQLEGGSQPGMTVVTGSGPEPG